MLHKWKRWAEVVRRDVVALWIAARDPRVPRGAKLMAGIAAGYALSPIDLIPDFIPVLGYVDDLILVPIGVWIAVRLVPAELMGQFRVQADALSEQPSSRAAAVGIILFWVAVMAVLFWAFWPAPVH
jgi:uncharacterized membrane protein YkvA (DUF1232 family)